MKLLSTKELDSLLRELGAGLVGFGDLTGLSYDGLDRAVALAVPHKTCCTRAGLGWIGKNALLVTPEYGPAVRLSSVLTDGDFDFYGEPVNASRCGSCKSCTDSCPGKAISGALWSPETAREALVDVEACRSAARKLAKERISEEITLCGKCIQVCPYTQGYLRRERRKA